MKCWYTNAYSWSNKLDEIKFSTTRPNIVTVTVMYSKPGDPIIKLNIQGYTTIHSHPKLHHLSVCVFVNSDLSAAVKPLKLTELFTL